MENPTDNKSETAPVTHTTKPYRVFLRYLVEVHVEATDEAEAIMKAHDEANHGDWETMDETAECLDSQEGGSK